MRADGCQIHLKSMAFCYYKAFLFSLDLSFLDQAHRKLMDLMFEIFPQANYYEFWECSYDLTSRDFDYTTCNIKDINNSNQSMKFFSNLILTSYLHFNVYYKKCCAILNISLKIIF